ncbi:cell division protein FtsA [Myxococcota bacterium]|nr:cell division protein FtsA [Myxococcota bacterium]MBU1537452.1 cell division protein FtsA [Myxococcota bacterium]
MHSFEQMDANLDLEDTAEFIAALDIGTSKLTISIGQVVNGKLRCLMGTVHTATKGIEQGRITNVQEVAKSLRGLMEDVEAILGFQVEEIHVGISDPSIAVHMNSAMVPVEDHVTRLDIMAVHKAAEAIPLQPYEAILHVLPTRYYVDKKAVTSPEGHRSVRLDVDAKIVTIPRSSIDAVQRVCAEVGLIPVEIIFTPLATALAVTNPRSAFLGTIVIDMGAGTTDVTVHEGNKITYFDVIPAGGDYITSDLAQGLHCLAHEAENIKLQYGCANTMYIAEEEQPISELQQAGFSRWEISYHDVAAIMGARIDEILTMVMSRMEQAEVEIKDHFEIILTGGTSQMSHIRAYVEEVFQLRTAIGIPNVPQGEFDLARKPQFASSVGLLMFANQEQIRVETQVESAPALSAQKPSVFSKVKSIFSGLFD